MTAAAIAAVGPSVAATKPLPEIVSATPTSGAPSYQRVMIREASSRTACEADMNRVFVKHHLGTECLAYFITTGHQLSRRAVIFLEGDIPRERMAADQQAKVLEFHRAFLTKLATAYKLPFVSLSRPGVLGSSGNHGERRKPSEALSIGAAIDAIKARHGFDQIVLVGQSGGSTIAASLLTLGRTDVVCAVLGSGNLAVVERYIETQTALGKKVSHAVAARHFYDPARHIASIVTDPLRRVFVIGDPNDQRTPFPQQQRFAEALRTHGHHAEIVGITGRGTESHGAAHVALPAAGMCAAAMDDNRIKAYLARIAPPSTPSERSAAAPAPQASSTP